MSWFLILLILTEVSFPTQMLALTGGPSQPEVQSFEPVGTSDMVDLFTGDFNYNIPLMDVDGYPINIAYHSGITMDQEASWVGLGWNINPGVINRNMRGLPDDFAGENVVKDTYMKPNKTWGVAANLDLEVFGYENLTGGLGFSFGFNFNNYTGPSINQSVSINVSAGSSGSGKLNGGLGLNSSSDGGLTIQPSVGFSAQLSDTEQSTTSLGVSVGTAFNSRAGLKQLTIGATVSSSINGTDGYGQRPQKGYKLFGSNASAGSAGVSSTFNFGTATFTPQIQNSMKNFSMSGSFTLGGEIWGLDGKIGVSGYYASQKLASNSQSNPAYGYLYSEKGQLNDNALMDFNREKDGSFTENTACLPITNYTFDTYAVSGQGVGGSYRPFRSDVGYVFDPAAHTKTDDDALSAEIGLGGYVHIGANVTVIDVSGRSGKWKNNNPGLDKLRFTQKGKGNDFENVYFKEANEKTVDEDSAFYAAAGYDAPVRPAIDYGNKYEPQSNAFGPVKRKKRDKRSSNLSFLKRSEYDTFAQKPVSNTYAAPAHHIAEMTTMGVDGSRYIYGIAAYNKFQKEVTFAIGSTDLSTHGTRLSTLNENEGIIDYQLGDNSGANQLGIDNYYSSTYTPAYAHSYLLTSVLSADYVDSDSLRGPSDGDLGSYTRFAYTKIDNYLWRTPYGDMKASFSEGLKSDKEDDKANYIYGQKELWYLDSVITKNYVAVFHKSDRIDGVGVKGENGGYNSGAVKMKKLDSISLYSKSDLDLNPSNALPIKRVHFVYTYDLCEGIDNVTSGSEGKLTLKKIFFTYQHSNKARLSPYIFDYHETVAAENPDYNIKGYDRWGNYKPNLATKIGVKDQTNITGFVADSVSTSDYPYVVQDTAKMNVYAAVWSLKEIQLPSGGKIKMTYESDDYAYVQNKQAGQMFKVVNYGTASDASNTYVNFSTAGGRFYFKLQPGQTDINKYLGDMTYVYFRFLVKMRDVMGYHHLEYVSGYGELDRTNIGTSGGFGYIAMKNVNLKKTGTHSANPVVKAAIQYGRLYMPKKVWTADASGITGMSNQGSLGAQILDALINSDFTKNIKDAIQGPNYSLFDSYTVAREFVAGKSWIRLVNPNKHKLGGGLRVKKIRMTDEWAGMTASEEGTADYGQEYTYNLPDGSSSGVASYEPQLGGDENPWRQPLFNEKENMLVPNDEFYQEEPMGESFFPAPNVGYSMVTVKNLQREDVTRHATGKVVHEFYTSKDFPVITKRTAVDHERAKDDPYSIRSLLKIDVRDYLTAAQGFCVELNDMHGKPKSQKVYQEAQSTPISSVEYRYKSDPYLGGSFKLKNKCTTIEKNGNVSVKTIGEFFDMVADFREDKTTSNTIITAINIDVLPIFGIPVPIPMVWPSFAKQKTRFRSATSTKVIQRFGILEETVAQDLGSIVSTKNLAYDAESGDVLLTQTTTNYNDHVYNFKYPAWWYYESMGPAYQNIDFEMNATTFATGVAEIGGTASYFKEGDELALYAGGVPFKKGWVDSVATDAIKVIDKFGVPVNGSYSLKIIRSGKRNTMTAEMATLTTLNNPLASLKSNAYENVLQAGAIEYSNKRKAHCDCITGTGSTLPYTSNPYVSGAKGNWRPLKSYTHLTGRKQSNYDGNTNIRKDGIFTSYWPYYQYKAGKWEMNPKDWTYVSEVTEFNVYSEELENKDALGRYSSATFGYNQSMALSVAANSQYKEQGYDGFEDYFFNPCADDHFKFASVTPSSLDAHTGRYSLRVSSGSPKTMTKQLVAVCTDTTGCQLGVDTTIISSSILEAEAIDGTAPYSYEWDIILGSPVISLITDGLQITATTFMIELRVTDSKGCLKTAVITR